MAATESLAKHTQGSVVFGAGERDGHVDKMMYRYLLTRTWATRSKRTDDVSGKCIFVMNNPSNADALRNDPTVVRCMGFADAWGYDGIIVANLQAYIATKPSTLWRAKAHGHDIIGPDNDTYLRDLAYQCSQRVLFPKPMVVCAWGSHAKAIDRAKQVEAIFRANQVQLHVLDLTGAGHPRHPLYLRSELKPKLWKGYEK